MRHLLMLLMLPMLSIGPTFAQPSTVPPSSLPVIPLSPATTEPAQVGSCDLCRPLNGRPGSDLPRHRPARDRALHPHTKTPGVSRSQKRSFGQLPHRKIDDNQEGSKQ